MKKWFWYCCIAGALVAGCQAPERITQTMPEKNSYYDMPDTVECTLQAEPAETAEGVADRHFPELGRVLRSSYLSTDRVWGEDVVYWHVVIAKDERWRARRGSLPTGEVRGPVASNAAYESAPERPSGK
jgi:hypothetical protein